MIGSPWAEPALRVTEELGVDVETGLTETEAAARLIQFGPNELRVAPPKPALTILVAQLRSATVTLLVVAVALTALLGEWLESGAIAVVIALNTAVGFVTELRAVRVMEALRGLGRAKVLVRRNTELRTVDAAAVVPGDIVLMEGGDIVSADMRLVEANQLHVDESTLTGESAPIEKGEDPVDKGASLMDRTSMLFRGTSVTRGSGIAVVVATGAASELGRIARLAGEANTERAPLEQRLDALAATLARATIVVALAVALIGIASGKPIVLIGKTALALAVATVPEGLPIVATVAMAVGMMRMARRNALVRRLSALETLGATGVLCVDKTGTLTENRMTVVRIRTDHADIKVSGSGLEGAGSFEHAVTAVDASEDEVLRALLEAAVLCNNAQFDPSRDQDRAVGDPLEVALLVAGAKAGLDRDQLLNRFPEMREQAFDSKSKLMATLHGSNTGFLVAVKGAPEVVVAAATHVVTYDGTDALDDRSRERWLERTEELAADGLRVIAIARGRVNDLDADFTRNLELLGVVAMLDPPRSDVALAIAACHQAGVKVIMVTGDHPATALRVAVAVGLVEDTAGAVAASALLDTPGHDRTLAERLLATPVIARVTPEQKLRLVVQLQSTGAIVGMTGDGVNDAPALRQADIGIAMGRRGTDVAREAADIVLTDDSFITIVAAIEQGRVIFHNIRTFVVYLISCNVSEIMIVGLAAATTAPIPVTPLQILFLNLVTDVFPALALGVSQSPGRVMKVPPRAPGEAILPRDRWMAIFGYGLLITVSVLVAFAWALRTHGEQMAVTVAFLSLALAQLWHVFNMRGRGSHPIDNPIVRNPWVWGALALCLMLLVAVVYVPGLATILSIVSPDAETWLVIGAASLAPLVVGQLILTVGTHTGGFQRWEHLFRGLAR